MTDIGQKGKLKDSVEFSMLRVKNVDKSFGDKKVLKKINLELKEKGIYGLLGVNGAGKTTLMRIIVGTLKADNGKVIGRDKNRTGYLPENNPLYPQMTVAEYLELIAKLKDENENFNILKVMGKCGLMKVKQEKIENLSKGFKQRVGLAAALLGNPKLLVLDEPTSGLDPKQVVEIKKIIKELAKDKTILISTHILGEAKDICDELIIINKGKIVLKEKAKKIKNLRKKFIELSQ